MSRFARGGAALPRTAALTLTMALATAGPLAAQAHDPDAHARHAAPYAGLQEREIAALSPEEVRGLLAGDGLGFALAAELHGHPGPRHVLDLAGELGLDDEQRTGVQDVFDRMQSEARRLGAEVVELERELDAGFAAGDLLPADVERLTARIGARRAELRAVHLVAHLETGPLLTAEQLGRYRQLRGYEPGGS